MGNDPSPSLAYLVVTHDGERHIGKLLESIPDGSRVVIADNASTDATLEIVSGFSRRLNLDVLRLETNRGYAAGINAGMAQIGTSANWVFVLNQDIVLSAEASSLQLPAYSGYAIVQPRILLPDGTVNVDELRMNVWGFAYPPDYATIPQPKAPKETFFFSGAAFLLDTHAYRETGPLDESLFLYYEEIDYSFRLAAKGKKVLFDPTWCVTHAYELSTGSARKMRLIWKNRRTIMERYASPLHRFLSLSGSPSSRKESGTMNYRLSTTDLLPGFHTRQIGQPLRFLVNLLAVPLGMAVHTVVRSKSKNAGKL